MVTTAKTVLFLIFGPAFGLLLIRAGVRRLWNAGSTSRKLDAIAWGSIGIVLGLAYIGTICWLMFGPSMDPYDR